jgi:hypothetical protein
MNPEDKPIITKEDELARASKLSQLYPQPSANSRSFVHNAPNSDEVKILKNEPTNWVGLMTTGFVLSLPFIIFEIGLSVLSSTSSTTEASQVGMLATVYLLFITGLAWLTYKHFSRNNHITIVNPLLAYLMVVLFSIPSILLTKAMLASNLLLSAQPFSAGMIIYYLIAIITFITATVTIIYLIQRQNKSESANLKAVTTFIALPYIIGLFTALLKML